MLAALLPTSFTFKGGNGGQFVAALERTFHQSACYMPVLDTTGAEQLIPKIHISARDTKDFLKQLAEFYGMSAPGQALGISYERWELSLLDQNIRTRYEDIRHGIRVTDTAKPDPLAVHQPDKPVIDGRVTIPPSDPATVSLGAMEHWHWTKSLSVDPFLTRVVVDCVSEGDDEASFLKAVAQAAGAKFSQTKEGYVLHFSPTIFRNRAVSACEWAANQDGFEKTPRYFIPLRFSAGAATYRILSDEELTAIYVANEHVSRRVLNNNEFATIAADYVTAITKSLSTDYPDKRLFVDEGAKKLNAQRLADSDLSKPAIEVRNSLLPLIGFLAKSDKSVYWY